jgi:phage terminase large subunit-like protein
VRSFVDWINEKGFYIADVYDAVSGKWTRGGKMQLFDHQREILSHVLTQGEDGQFPYTTVIYSAPKKSGKTAIGAAIGEWAAEEFPVGTEIYTLANDQEQNEGRVYKDIAFHVKHVGLARPLKFRIQYPNDTYIQAIAKEYKSAAGSRHSMTLWDELWGYDDERARRLWAEMTPIPTVPYSLRIVATYAGFEGIGLLWDLYNTVVTNGEPVPELAHLVDAFGRPVCWRKGRMFAYWDTEPRMPWQTTEYYDQQRAELRPSDYLRLHENQWVTTHEAFIPIEWWDECSKAFDKSVMYLEDSPYRTWPVIMGVDIGVKSDCSAVVGVCYDFKRKKAIVAFHKIWLPTPGEDLDLENTVEKYIMEMSQKMRVAEIAYDPSNFHRSMTTLKKMGLHMVEFTQSPKNMIAATQCLFDALRERRIEAYPADDLREHLKWAVAEQKGAGFRLVKETHKSRHKIDGAVALAMALHRAIETGGADLRKPIRVEMPFSDISSMKQKSKQEIAEEFLPEPLRSTSQWMIM